MASFCLATSPDTRDAARRRYRRRPTRSLFTPTAVVAAVECAAHRPFVVRPTLAISGAGRATADRTCTSKNARARCPLNGVVGRRVDSPPSSPHLARSSHDTPSRAYPTVALQPADRTASPPTALSHLRHIRSRRGILGPPRYRPDTFCFATISDTADAALTAALHHPGSESLTRQPRGPRGI